MNNGTIALPEGGATTEPGTTTPAKDKRVDLQGQITRAARIDELQTQISQRQAMEHIERLRTPGTARGTVLSTSQGMMFGFADEVKGAVRAIWDRLPEEDYADAYLRIRDQTRAELESFRRNRPALAIGSEIAGGILIPGAATGSTVVKGTTAGARIARGAVAGAVTGGAFGAGQAEELRDVPRGVVTGSTTGAAIGAVIPGAIEATRAGARGVQAIIRPEAGATRRISQALFRDEMTPEQILGALDEAKSLGKPVTVADVGGEAVRRELEVAVQSPGPAGQIAEKALAARNKEQLTRISRDLVRGVGIRHTNITGDVVEDAIERTMKIRKTASKQVYERAMDFNAELNDDVVAVYNKVTQTPLGKEAMGKAHKILNVENFDEAPLMERIDAFKRGLDDMIGSAKRQGENSVAAKALSMKKELVGLVDNVNPDYKSARKIWENESNYLDAIDNGRDIMKPGFTAAKLKREFAAMTDNEQEAFRIGAVDAIITRMRQQSAQEPNMIKLLRSPEMRDKLKSIMTPQASAKIDRIFDIEDAMFRTATQARRGSQTAQRTAAMAEQQKQVGLQGLIEEITSLVITPLRNVIVHRIPTATRAAKDRLIARQNAQIAKRLLSSEADELLRIPPEVVRPPFVTGGRLIPGAIAAEEGQ